jgi:hypothetical protein
MQKTSAQNIGKSHYRHDIGHSFADSSRTIGAPSMNVLLTCAFDICGCLPKKPAVSF